MKKIVLFVLMTLMILPLFGAGQGEAESSGDVQVLTVWDDKSNDQEASVIAPLIEEWNSANPSVRLIRDAVDVESYKMKLKTAIAANEAPDLFYSYAGGFSKPFVDAGKILALDEYLSEGIRERALSGTWTYATYGDSVYGLPIGMWAGVLFCNEALFDKYGLEVPETFDDLLTVSEAFRAGGMGALSVGGAEAWTPMFYHNIIAVMAAGADRSNAVLAGADSFGDEDFRLAADKLALLLEKEAFVDGFNSLNYDESVALFMQEQVPMIYQGDWLAGQIQDSPLRDKVRVVNFPLIPEGTGANTDFLGGATDVYMVSARTENKGVAVEALEFICENYSTKGFYAGKAFPVYKADLDYSMVGPVTKQIADVTKSSTGYVLSWDTFLEGKDAQLHLDLVQELFAGVVDSDGFSDGMSSIH